MEYNNDFINVAIQQAKLACDAQEVPVGAAIVYHNKVIAKAYNLVEQQNNALLHAELIVIQQAIQILQTKHLYKCSIYVTLEPCPMCAYAISLARIQNLYFGATDVKSGGVINGTRIFASHTCHYRPKIYPGIRELECTNLLGDFFKKQRNNKKLTQNL